MNTMDEMLDRVIEYLCRCIPKDFSRSEIHRDVFDNDANIPIDALLLQLKEDGHVFNPIGIRNNVAYDRNDRYSITNRGIGFVNNSFLPNKPYQAKEQNRQSLMKKEAVHAKLARREAFPKQNWMVLPLVTFSLGIASTVGVEFIKRKMWPDTKPNIQIIIVRDTIRIPVRQAVNH